jgi:hypothetical protein
MAKGKKAKSKGKADGGFPRKIAGIRVPKKVRKVAGGAVSFLDHPVVADIVAAALFTAANTLSKTSGAKKAPRARPKAAKAAAVTPKPKPKRKKPAKKR